MFLTLPFLDADDFGGTFRNIIINVTTRTVEYDWLVVRQPYILSERDESHVDKTSKSYHGRHSPKIPQMSLFFFPSTKALLQLHLAVSHSCTVRQQNNHFHDLRLPQLRISRRNLYCGLGSSGFSFLLILLLTTHFCFYRGANATYYQYTYHTGTFF